MVSIIIPFYNCENQPMTGLRSALHQKYMNLEIICIDDGSQDNTYDILNKYANKYSCIRLLRSEHIGVGEARNYGIKNAKGKFIVFLDSDDEFASCHTVSLLVDHADKTGFDIVGGSMYRKIDGKVDHNWDNLCKGFVFDKECELAFSDYQFEYGFYRFIYSKDFLIKNEITFPRFSRYQDTLFMVKALHCAKKFYALPEIVYIHNTDNRLNNWSLNQSLDYLDAVLEMLQFAKANKYEILARNTVLRISDFIPNMQSHFDLLEVRNKIYHLLNEIDCFSLEDIIYFSWSRLGAEIRTGFDRESSLKRSKSYKIGRAITAIPRSIKKIITGVGGNK